MHSVGVLVLRIMSAVRIKGAYFRESSILIENEFRRERGTLIVWRLIILRGKPGAYQR
jgi:hypothetical protein